MRNSITVQNSLMPLVEYQGQRVVTFAMVEAAHQRPKGTARATFNRNRHRFISGRHFFEPSSDVIRTMMQRGVFPRKTARGVLITEMGYLLLV
ncbi:ORF6N domain-containing protein, partial [Salmonella enterica]|uniref:ORF6N domain-containing protein n=1 Tax=Salmonella enterica TaxID=28901 RepID=UPI001116A91C